MAFNAQPIFSITILENGRYHATLNA